VIGERFQRPCFLKLFEETISELNAFIHCNLVLATVARILHRMPTIEIETFARESPADTSVVPSIESD